MKKIIALLIGVILILVTGLAHAEANKTINNVGKEEGYGYEFDDDPLNAGGFGPNDSVIKVRPRAARTTLIRPRTSFVPEMLKSIEQI
jgi:hypothetical protein